MNRLKQIITDPTPEDMTNMTIILIGLMLVMVGIDRMVSP